MRLNKERLVKVIMDFKPMFSLSVLFCSIWISVNVPGLNLIRKLIDSMGYLLDHLKIHRKIKSLNIIHLYAEN